MMTEALTTQPGFDPILLARMTGELGTDAVIEKLSAELASVYMEFLPDIFMSETGFAIEVGFESCASGMQEELMAGLGDDACFCDGALRGWSPRFALGCGNTFVMTLVEALLGAEPSTITPPKNRQLSKIELDLAEMVFQRIAGVLRSAIPAVGSYEPILEKPHNAANRPKPQEGYKEPYAARISMKITLGNTNSLFHVIVPQKHFLKTVLVSPKSVAKARAKQEWAAKIKEQVQRSQVPVEARIHLEPMKLNTISRLQVGDFIPFDGQNDIKVEVNSNGKKLYFGEFGRSGAKYTVRITGTYTAEVDILDELMS